MHVVSRFELGSALFVGWGGSALLVVGGFVYSITAGKEGCRSRYRWTKPHRNLISTTESLAIKDYN